MPEKEGAEEKTTKSVVNKRQKQMMNKEEYTTEMVRKIKKKISARAVYPIQSNVKIKNEVISDTGISNKNPVKKQKNNLDEEGYDIARDEGRVRPSKDKKDATTMPPSKEMKKTQKVNKGPSALERVKKKYGKAVMKMDKKKANEELDLTQVAESFGGYIIEAQKKDPDTRGLGQSQRKIVKKQQEIIKSPKAQAKDKLATQQQVSKLKKFVSTTAKTDPVQDQELAAFSKTGAKAQKEIENQTGRSTGDFTSDLNRQVDKASGTGLPIDADDGTVAKTIGGMKTYNPRKGDPTPEGKVAKAQRLKNRKPRTIPFKFKRTYSPEVQKKVDAVMKGIETKKIINPDKRSSKRVSASGTPFKIPSKPKSTPLFFTNRPKGVGDTGTGLRKSLKQFKIDADSFDKKLKTLKTDIKQTKTKLKQIPQPEVEKIKPKNVKLVGGSKVTGDVEPDFVGPKAAPRSRNKVVQRIKVAARSTKRPVQRLAKPAGSALAKTAKFAGKNPFATLVGASMAKDTFFPVKLPKPPTVQGGKVGRRTAG